MVTILRSKHYISMPWKNGLGLTRQIALDPSGVDFIKEAFTYRISLAQAQSSGVFSQFAGYRRTLLLVTGSRIVCNDVLLLPFEFFHFSGSEMINYQLPEGPIEDLGIIYDPKKVTLEARILNGAACPEKHNLQLPKGHHYLFCARGRIHFENDEIVEGDTLFTTNSLEFKTTGATKLVLFSLELL